MNNTALFGLLVILQVFGFIGCSKENNSSALFAQSTNDAQRIVGTWKPEGESLTFTFTANGEFTISGLFRDTQFDGIIRSNDIQGNYYLVNSKLFLHERGSGTVSIIDDCTFLADGRVLVFEYSYMTQRRDYKGGPWWFMKQ